MVFQLGSSFLAMANGILLARFIGAEGYGVYSYALAWVNFLVVIVELGFPILLVREVAVLDSEKDWAHLKGLIIRTFQLLLVTSGLMLILSESAVLALRNEMSESLLATFILCFLLFPIIVYARATTAILKGLQHVVKSEALLIFFRPLLFFCTLCLILFLIPGWRRPQSVMLLQIIIALITLAISVLVAHRFLPGDVLRARGAYQTRKWLASAIPLTLNSTVLILANSTDILVLGLFWPAEDVGVYRVAVQGAALVSFPMMAATAALAPQFARLFSQKDHERLQRLVTTSVRIVFFVTLPAVLVLVMAGGRVAALVFGPEFARCYTPLTILVLSQLFSVAMGAVTSLLYMTGHERDATRGMIMSAGLNIILNFAFVPIFGISGAAAASLASNVVLHYLLYRTVKSKISINSSVFALSMDRSVP